MSLWTARCPGKLILSGEHAVVYGAPALAVAVNRHATVRAALSPDDGWRVRLPGLPAVHLSGESFRTLADRVDHRYAEFTAGRLDITGVLDQPGELLLYALSLLARDRGSHPAEGLELDIESTLPIGSGMGSSAALLLATLAAAGPALEAELTREQLYPYALRGEMIQHGKSSGVDPHVCLHGGLFRFRHGDPTRLDVATGQKFTVVFTGRPESTTGECVEAVRKKWGQHGVWTDFVEVTASFERALLTANTPALKAAIRHNHRLLNTIGVVPAPVGRFVREVEARNGAAKVCGAGAIRGPAGGVVLVVCDTTVDDLAAAQGYEVMPVAPDLHGVRNA